MNKSKYAGPDYFKLIAAFLVIGIHTYPFKSINADFEFIFTHIISRTAVPFFLTVTGYFVVSPYLADKKQSFEKARKFISKTGILYLISILIYLPVNIYNGYFSQEKMPLKFLTDILFEGTFYHLWYLPASIFGVYLIYLLSKKLKFGTILAIAGGLYLLGLTGDSYFGLTEQIPFISGVFKGYFGIFEYTRNGLFYAPVFLMLGGLTAHIKSRRNIWKNTAGLAISVSLMLAEGILLNTYDIQKHDSMYIFLIPVMYFLFTLVLEWKGRGNKNIRTISTVIYIIHPGIIVVLRGAAKALDMRELLIENSIIHYICVCVMSFSAACIFVRLREYAKVKRTPVYPYKRGRSWADINMENLKHNVGFFRTVLPDNCKIMAVVKADAYGHGACEISKELNRSGIRNFAVATLQEGINIRKAGVVGEILILGYTWPADIECFRKYDLTQTVTDIAYARDLDRNCGKVNKRIKVHVKIDTGMNRLGERFENHRNIFQIYSLYNLIVTGTYTHLSRADDITEEGEKYSVAQIRRFNDTVRILEKNGFRTGEKHIQSTYGVLNYPWLCCDYARIGIGLYGVLSHSPYNTAVKADIKPVLSLHSRIIIVKDVYKGENVGYGTDFTATEDMRIAVVSIGYADGIPRNFSYGGGHVLVNSCKVPVIGKVCMDQMIIDVTGMENINNNDTVTIIGKNGNEFISCEEFSAQCGTISNEILSRLGRRLDFN